MIRYVTLECMYHAVKACRILMNNARDIPLPHNQREVCDFLHAQRTPGVQTRFQLYGETVGPGG
jgi:hypothetical protein